jgi:hypothetical protein
LPIPPPKKINENFKEGAILWGKLRESVWKGGNRPVQNPDPEKFKNLF